jgi:hypothetical protein
MLCQYGANQSVIYTIPCLIVTHHTGLTFTPGPFCIIIHSLLFPLPASSRSSSVFLLLLADVLELVPSLPEVSRPHASSSSPNRTSKPSSLTIWNGKGWPSRFLLGGLLCFLLRDREPELAFVDFAKTEGNNFVKSGLQPGRQPQMIPMEVSMLMITKRTVPCPVKVVLVGGGDKVEDVHAQAVG